MLIRATQSIYAARSVRVCSWEIGLPIFPPTHRRDAKGIICLLKTGLVGVSHVHPHNFRRSLASHFRRTHHYQGPSQRSIRGS